MQKHTSSGKMTIDHAFYMQLCIDEAWKYQGLTYPNPAVGACILDPNGKLLAVDAHKAKGTPHAELSVIETLFSSLGDTSIPTISDPKQLHDYICTTYQDACKGYTIYVTLEPCNHTGSTPPCALLIETLGFSTVVIGTKDPNSEAAGGMQRLKNAKREIIYGILEEACKMLLLPFLKWQQNKPFIFFKLALTQNGVYSPGTITSLDSRTHVHALRDKTDLLIIGGNTVRIDRPTLDARLVNGKAPDVCIYSKQTEFDRSIPLFHVTERNVSIVNNFNSLAYYHFVMIEGGEGTLKETLPIIDALLIYVSPHFKVGEHIDITQDFAQIHSQKVGSDTLAWFKKI